MRTCLLFDVRRFGKPNKLRCILADRISKSNWVRFSSVESPGYGPDIEKVMCADTKGVLATVEGIALLVVADTALGELLAREVQRYMNLGTLTVVSQLAQASERLRVTAPLAILLDDAILLGALLIEL